jgi:hypothetical protein
MFVVANTRSMERYRADVIAAVQRFVESGVGDNSNVRIAAAVYGDYSRRTARLEDVQFMQVVPFSAPDSGAIKALSRLATFADPQQDMLEAPYAALIRAANQSGWRENAAFRYVVHIADRGNRSLDRTSPDGTSALVERISIDDVARKFVERRLIYVPIAVLGNSATSTNPYADPARRAFLQQARALIEKLPANSSPLQITYDEAAPREESGVQARIQAAIEKAVHLSEYAASELCTQTAGTTPWCVPRPRVDAGDPSLGMIIPRMLEEQGLKDLAGNVTSRRTQTLAAYYFPPRTGGKPTFTYWLALDASALDRLVFLSDSVCKYIGETGSFQYLKREILAVTELTVGETLSPAEAVERRLFIPAAHLSPLMTKEWADLEEELRDPAPEKLEAMEKEFCRKSALITSVQQGFWVAPDALVWNPNAPKAQRWSIPKAARKPFDWSYDSGDGVPFYYVPVEFLP